MQMSRKLMLLCNERQSLLFTNGTKFVRNCTENHGFCGILQGWSSVQRYGSR